MNYESIKPVRLGKEVVVVVGLCWSGSPFSLGKYSQLSQSYIVWNGVFIRVVGFVGRSIDSLEFGDVEVSAIFCVDSLSS